MAVHPIMIAGAVLSATGILIFGALLFSHGGVAKSAQFRVLGELFGGTHGARSRALLLLSFVLLPIGACLLFAGVAAADHERAERCEAFCAAEGYASARMGPNSNRVRSDRSTWFVACICEGGEGEALEIDANNLLPAP